MSKRYFLGEYLRSILNILVSNSEAKINKKDETVSADLEREAKALELSSLTQAEAIEIGSIAQSIGLERKLPIAVEVRMKEWIVFHASLPGSTPENDWWIGR